MIFHLPSKFSSILRTSSFNRVLYDLSRASFDCVRFLCMLDRLTAQINTKFNENFLRQKKHSVRKNQLCLQRGPSSSVRRRKRSYFSTNLLTVQRSTASAQNSRVTLRISIQPVETSNRIKTKQHGKIRNTHGRKQ